MPDLEVRHAPALVSHVLGHDRETLRFDLADAVSIERMLVPPPAAAVAVGEGREHQAIAMQIGAHEQHRAADRVEADEVLQSAKVSHAEPPLVAPGVEIEGRPPELHNAVRVHDVPAGGKK